MLQWEEEVNTVNDRKEYTYKAVWSSNLINSSDFRHRDNPKKMIIESSKLYNEVYINNCLLAKDQLD